MMLLTTLAALALQTGTTAPLPRTIGPLDEARFNACMDSAVDDPANGINEANRWLGENGGFLARQCLGFALSKRGNYSAAAETFMQAALDAEVARDWRVANLWAQAGNAALAAGDALGARNHLNAALARGTLRGEALGLAQLDRARASLAAGDFAAGRADLDAAATNVPNDPLVWLLSATLARRQNDLARAQADIQQAAVLGPRDAAIALEAGNIAWAADRVDAARASWQSAVTLDPNSPAGVTARVRIAELDRDASDAASPPPGPDTPRTPVPVPPQSR